MANNYPVVFVHGMFGWGSNVGLDRVIPYWGATSGSLTKYLRSKGIDCYCASVGPVSSAWDNACELYAQLTGTRVDYGKAHSELYGHKRYGRIYPRPALKGLDERKIHLVGHSHGGQVVRLLCHLLTYGDEREKRETPKEELSGLFTGGKEQLIESVVTLCSPNNGTTVYDMAERKNLVHTMGRAVNGFIGIMGRTPLNGRLVDYQLEHFGLTALPSDGKPDKLLTAMNRLRDSDDNVLSDISFQGAVKLNKIIKTSENVHYFCYRADATEQGGSKLSHIRFPVLMIFGTLIKNHGIPENKAGITFDSSWLATDGVVNTVSALNPSDERAKLFDGKPERGVWNIMPLIKGDHGMPVGLLKSRRGTHLFYDDMLDLLHSL